jgi:signal transduction histidine kinase
MLKKFFNLLDFFLPPHVVGGVDITILFRARSIIATGLLGVLILLFLLIGTSWLNVALFIRIGIFVSLLAMLSLIIFMKTRTQKFEYSLNIGAFIQILILFSTVYLSAFSARGIGFFGLICLAPLFLLTAFYFKPFYGFLFFIFNVALLSVVTYFYSANFFLPIQHINFKSVYLLYLFLILISNYLLSYLFIMLNVVLKNELSKQKSLLLESAKFQSLGQMASNLAHDINNPLFTIQGKLHQIRNLLSQDQLDLFKCDNIIEDVEGTILRLSQIVKGISTFARQGYTDQMVSISADEIIKGIVLLSSDRIVQLGITFDIKISPDIKIICYPAYISQVMVNLLNNAIDAIENAKVKLIQVEAFVVDKWIEIHVKDSGLGIDSLIKKNIFDSFFTTKKNAKGAGLGLSISKGLVEIHEGTLTYQRTGNMTDFIIRLPSYE